MTIDASLVAAVAACAVAYCSYSAWTSSRMTTRGEVTRTFGNGMGGAFRSLEKPAEDANKAAETESTAHEPTIADVLVVKAMLIKALNLPAELVDAIVDLAEYWPHTTTEASFDGGVPVARGGGDRHGKENVFLLRFPPLGLRNWERVTRSTNDIPVDQAPPKPQPPGEEFSADDFQELIASPVSMLAQPCRRIVFTIKSRDQGWGGDHGARNTYKSSWTWFEAGLERWCKTSPAHTGSAGQQTQQQKPSLNLDDLCTIFPEVKPDEKRAEGYTFDHPLHAREDLKIQCNLTATKEPKVHRVVWSYTDDVDPERDVEAAEKLATTWGRGKATGNGKFVRDLKLGDVVTIWAKARFGSWCNYVHSVKMDVYYAI